MYGICSSSLHFLSAFCLNVYHVTAESHFCYFMIFLLYLVSLLRNTDCLTFSVSNLGIVLTGVQNETQIYLACSCLVRSLINYRLFSNKFHEVAIFFSHKFSKKQVSFRFLTKPMLLTIILFGGD